MTHGRGRAVRGKAEVLTANYPVSVNRAKAVKEPAGGEQGKAGCGGLP
jgi:hypothetical protein